MTYSPITDGPAAASISPPSPSPRRRRRPAAHPIPGEALRAWLWEYSRLAPDTAAVTIEDTAKDGAWLRWYTSTHAERGPILLHAHIGTSPADGMLCVITHHCSLFVSDGMGEPLYPPMPTAKAFTSTLDALSLAITKALGCDVWLSRVAEAGGVNVAVALRALERSVDDFVVEGER